MATAKKTAKKKAPKRAPRDAAPMDPERWARIRSELIGDVRQDDFAAMRANLERARVARDNAREAARGGTMSGALRDALTAVEQSFEQTRGHAEGARASESDRARRDELRSAERAANDTVRAAQRVQSILEAQRAAMARGAANIGSVAKTFGARAEQGLLAERARGEVGEITVPAVAFTVYQTPQGRFCSKTKFRKDGKPAKRRCGRGAVEVVVERPAYTYDACRTKKGKFTARRADGTCPRRK